MDATNWVITACSVLRAGQARSRCPVHVSRLSAETVVGGVERAPWLHS